MSSDIGLGDVVVCVDASDIKPHVRETPTTKIAAGKMYRVTGLIDVASGEGLGILLNDEAPHQCLCCFGNGAWRPARFRKLRAADAEFTARIRGKVDA